MKFLSKFTRRLMLDYSPLELLNDHARRVQETTNELARVIDSYIGGEEIKSERISELEHAADRVKQEIRNNLPRSDLLMPVARTDVLSFLWQQDQIADSCQDAATMLSLLPIDISSELGKGFKRLAESIGKGSMVYLEMVEESTEILTSSLSQKQIDALWEMIDQMNTLEHEADEIEASLVKKIYKDKRLDGFQKYHLIQVVLKAGNAIDHMENAGEYLRIMTAR